MAQWTVRGGGGTIDSVTYPVYNIPSRAYRATVGSEVSVHS